MREKKKQEYTELTEEVIRLCKLKAMHLLEYSDRTEAQLKSKLEEGGFPPSAVSEAIDYVKSFHYIDDRRYAESYIRVNKERKSRLQLKKILSERGVSRQIIDDVMQDTEFDETDSIKRQFLKKYANADLTDPKTYEKAMRYFASKGYGYSDIKDAVTEALEELNTEEEQTE